MTAKKPPDFAEADAELAAMAERADVLLAGAAELLKRDEGVSLDDALPLAARRFPLLTARYFAEGG